MELSRKISKRRYFKSTIVYFLTCCMFFNTSLSVALAGPEGAQVVNGQVSFQQSSYNTTITASDKSIINYSSFDIARPEIVQFIQPGSSASVLNRILSANPTNINGTLLANGRVFFVNPAGVYIGAGARINVNQLVASGLNITNSDFINGQYNFAGGEGAVINSGDISAEKVYLIGRQVANSGSISCPAGYVVMASGDRVFLGEPGTDVVLEVDAPSLPESADPIEGSGVLNEGTIEAAGGKIVLAAGDIYSQAISNTGSLSASFEAGEAGQVKLIADGGQVTNTGTIEASGSKGGQVEMEGARVGQFGTVHADGTDSDGGSVDLQASEVVALSSDSLTTANAGTNGDGGDVIVVSPDTALFWPNARIEAKGGELSGDGGFIEVSGWEHVEVYGSVDTRAANGEVGLFLIDPYSNIELTSASGHTNMNVAGDPWFSTDDSSIVSIPLLVGAGGLQGSDIEIETREKVGGAEVGDITVVDPIDFDGIGDDRTLTLDAHHDIIINNTISDSSPGGESLSLVFEADNDVKVNAAITTNGGSFTSSGINFNTTASITGGAPADETAIDLSGHSGTVTASTGTLNTTGGDLLVEVDDNGSDTGGFVTIGEAIDAIGNVSGDTFIEVAAGTYTEDLAIATDGLNLAGADDDHPEYTVIKGVDVEPLGNYPFANPNIDIQANEVEIHGFTIESPDVKNDEYSSGIVLNGENIQIYDNIFNSTAVGNGHCVVIQTYRDDVLGYNSNISGLNIHDNTFQGTPGGDYRGVFINHTLTGTGTVFVQNNEFYGNILQGIVTERDNTSISGNLLDRSSTYQGRGIIVMDWGDPPDDPDPRSQDNVSITGNTIQGFEYGIRIGHGAGTQDLTNITVANNTFQDNTTGVQVRSSADGVFVNYNKITDNTTGVDNIHAATLDATGNWWGDASGPTHTSNTGGTGAVVSDDVDYSPWLADGTDTSADPGFQPIIAMPWRMLESTVFDDDWAEWLNYATNEDKLILDYSGSVAIGGTGPITDSSVTGTDGVSLDVTSGGAITIDGKVALRGNLDLDAGTTLTVNESIDPGYVNIQANDIVVNSLISAADFITLTAGTDGSGSVTVDHTGLNTGELETTETGSDITIIAGTTSGNIVLDGPVTAVDQVTMTASGGTINGSGLVTASTVALNADTGIGNSTALELAASTISAGNATSGNIDIDNALGTAVTVSSLTTLDGGTILFENTGAGGVSFGTVSTTTDGTPEVGEDDITLSSDSGDLTISTSVTADGAGDINYNTTTSGNVVLTGTTTALDDEVTMNSVGTINGSGLVTASTVALNADTGIGNSTALELAASTISAGNATSGNIDIDNALGTAVTVSSLTTLEGGTILFENTGAGGVSFGTVSTTTDGTPEVGEDDITLSSDSGDLTISTSVTADGAGDINYNTTTSGNVVLTGTTTALDDEVTMNSVGTINGSGLVTASTVALNADTGIGNSTALELAASTISAGNATSGNIDIDNALGTAVTVSSLTTLDGGTILFENTGAGGVSFGTVSTTTDGTPEVGEDDITLSSDSGDLTISTSVTADGAGDINYNTTTSGNVVLTGTTTALDDEVTMNSVGTINGSGLVTASTVALNADTGIGNSTALELAASTISAGNATSGNIDIDNALGTAVTVSSLTTLDGGTILFENTGAGGVSFGTVSTTTDGTPEVGEDDITLSSDSGDLTISTSVTADGDGDINYNTTTSGNVVLTGTTTALDDEVTMNSVGTINGSGLVTASTVALNADTGIGNSTALELAASTISAGNATSGNIDIDNALGTAVTVSSLTTLDGGTILFENTGAGGVSFGTVSTTTDGTPEVGEDDITLSSDSGDLTISTSVTADGAGDINYNTTTSGNVVLTGTTTALDDEVTMNSVGTINGSGLVTASTVALNADTGIGNSTALELAASTISAGNATSGNIDIDNALASAVTASSLTTGTGNIWLSQAGGGSLEVTTASTINGNVEVDVTGTNANLKVGDITASSSGNVVLEATEGEITQDSGTITANGGSLTMKQRDSLDLTDFSFGNRSNTDITLQSYNGSITAVDTANGGKDDNAADQWNSITATAENNIVLQGSDATEDIKIGGSLFSNSGGVSIISDKGTIRTAGDTILDNVAITGYSDDTGTNNTGVDLPAGTGKAAIVILSKLKDLNLGSNATLTAYGSYDDSLATGVDDRASVSFLPPPETDVTGERIDIAIYLGSFNHKLDPSDAGGNVTVNSTVSMPDYGTMVIDAHDTVEPFISNFTDSDPWNDITNSLEVVSRISQTLDDAADNKRLPHADEARSDIVPSWFGGEKYVLRGKDAVLAEVLGKIEPVPLVLPKPLAPEDQGQVQIERRDAELLGLGDKPELARAYPPSLNTDLNLDKAAQILYVLMPILRDSSRIATLDRIVVEIWQDVDQPIAPEQEAMIAQRMSGTPAEEWVAALTEYVNVMSTMVGRPKTESVLWVMQTYVIPQAEEGLLQDQTVAFLEAQID